MPKNYHKENLEQFQKIEHQNTTYFWMSFLNIFWIKKSRAGTRIWSSTAAAKKAQ